MNTKYTAYRRYKFLGLLTALYITFQLISDVTAGKIISFFGFPVSVTVVYFPVTYILSDVLTEVYGYAKARSVIWTVLLCSVLAGSNSRSLNHHINQIVEMMQKISVLPMRSIG